VKQQSLILLVGSARSLGRQKSSADAPLSFEVKPPVLRAIHRREAATSLARSHCIPGATAPSTSGNSAVSFAASRRRKRQLDGERY
jgi:hypothetical protein